MRDVNVWVVGVCLLALVAPLANAELVTINIEGVVDTVEDDGNYLQDQIHVGDIITGWYTYDTATPDSNPLENVGHYEHSTSLYGVHLTVGGFTFMTDPTNVDFGIEIVNDYPTGDDYAFGSSSNLDLPNGTQVGIIQWYLNDSTGNALSSVALPTSPPVLEDWQSNLSRIYGERAEYRIDGHITSAIPEPASVLLFVIGSTIMFTKKP